MGNSETGLSAMGRARKHFLQNNAAEEYARLQSEGLLQKHLLEVQAQAEEMLEVVLAKLLAVKDMPDKNSQPKQWVRCMAAIQSHARQQVMQKIICAL